MSELMSDAHHLFRAEQLPLPWLGVATENEVNVGSWVINFDLPGKKECCSKNQVFGADLRKNITSKHNQSLLHVFNVPKSRVRKKARLDQRQRSSSCSLGLALLRRHHQVALLLMWDLPRKTGAKWGANEIS